MKTKLQLNYDNLCKIRYYPLLHKRQVNEGFILEYVDPNIIIFIEKMLLSQIGTNVLIIISKRYDFFN